MSITRAADINVTASLSESTTEVGQPVQLQIKISGSREASLPEVNISGLDIHYSGQSTQVQMNNFNVTMSVVHTYTIMPQRAGTFTIPSLEIKVDQTIFKTNPLTLNVGSSASAAGNNANANARNVFSELIVPKQTAYVGEVIPVEVRIYVDARIHCQMHELPTLSGEGFTVQKLTQPTQNQTQRDGKQYDLVIFKTAITPVKTGKLTLGPAEINCIAQLPQQRRQRPHFGNGLDDFFNDPFFNDPFGNNLFTQQQRITIKSEPLEIQVKPLPASGQPKSFSGAVGQFTLASNANPTKVKAGDPITVTLKISGRGNFDRVTSPQMVEENGWRSYPPSAKFQVDDDVGISGAKTFEMAVIPDEKKETLPEIHFSYFDPVTEKYVTLRGNRTAINVEASGAASVAQTRPQSASPQPSAAAAPAPNANDIQYLRTDSGRWGESFEPVYAHRIFWVAQAAPLLALIGFIGFQAQRTRRSDMHARQLIAWRKEQNDLLKTLHRSDTDSAAFFEAATKYIQIETARKTGNNPSGIGASDVLDAAKLDAQTAGDVRAIFEANAELRYAGMARGGDSLSQEKRGKILAAIQNIEKTDV